jgi:hypothetical protein
VRLTPRGTEVKAVVALLESDQFDSADALAKAIIKEVADHFSHRDWYAWVYRENPEAFYLPFGIFSSDIEAKKFAGRYVSMLKGEHMILHLHSSADLDARMATHKIPSKFCQNCNHSLVVHEHPKIQPKCAVRGCNCRRAIPE